MFTERITAMEKDQQVESDSKEEAAGTAGNEQIEDDK